MKLKRLFCILMACALVLCAVPALAAEADGSVTFKEVEKDRTFSSKLAELSKYYSSMVRDDEIVRIIVELEEGESLAEAGQFDVSTRRAENMRSDLLATHDRVFNKVKAAVGSVEREGDYTLLLNGFSVETVAANLGDILAVDGVKDAYIATVFTCPTPQMSDAVAGDTNVDDTWDLGYTGKGSVIAIIDTGVYLEHEAFALAPEDARLDEEAVAAAIGKAGFHGTDGEYYSEKIPFIYDYRDGDTDVSTAHNHGTHVAGIAAGHAGEEVPTYTTGVTSGQQEQNGTRIETTFSGVAPDAQIVAMKVFDDAGEGAYSDDTIEAIEDAITLGVDVINLSLGSPAGFAYEPGYSDALARAEEFGVVMAISAGNEAANAEGNMLGYGYPSADYADYGLVGSPGSVGQAITVASVENLKYQAYCIKVDDEVYPYDDPASAGQHHFLDLAREDAYEYVMVPGLGKAGDFEDIDVEGKIAVIKRGTITFEEKRDNAAAAGAIAVIIYNSYAGNLGMLFEHSGIPAVSVTMEAGAALRAAETKELYVLNELSSVANSVGGQVSDFSSWGVLPNLELGVDIAAPGGMIRSCDNTTDTAYVNMSGTSMSSPFIAGCAAVMFEYMRAKDLYDDDDALCAFAIKSLLMATAEPLDGDYGLYSPRLQGSGLVDLAEAVFAADKVLLYKDGETIDFPVLNGYDSETGTWTAAVNIENTSGEKLNLVLDSVMTFQIAGYADYDDPTWNGTELDFDDIAALNYLTNVDASTLFTTSYTAANGVIDEIDNTELLTIEAGHTCKLEVTVTIGDTGLKQYFEGMFANGAFVEGYVYLSEVDVTSVPDDDPIISQFVDADYLDLSVPFIGFNGVWENAPIFDTDYEALMDYQYYYFNGETDYDWTPAGIAELNPSAVLALSYEYDDYYFLGDQPYYGLAYYDPDMSQYLDDGFTSEHNAISGENSNSNYFADYAYLAPVLLRNASLIRLEVVDDETGKVYYDSSEDSISWNDDYVSKSFYNANYDQIMSNVDYSWDGWDYDDANYVPNGTKVNMIVSAVLEYDDNGDGVIDWDDNVQTWETPLTVDYQKPLLSAVHLNYNTQTDDYTLKIETIDNHYIASVELLDEDYNLLDVNFGTNTESGERELVPFDFKGLESGKYMVCITDYASNYVYYEIIVMRPDDPLKLPGGGTPAEPDEPEDEVLFDDLKGYDWAEDAINELAKEGIIEGVADRKFAPGNPIRRGDFVLILTRALETDVDFDTQFADVKEGSYWYDAIGMAKKLGYILGSGNSFRPSDTITREEFFTILYRVIGSPDISEEDAKEALKAFTDADSISSWAVKACAWFAKDGTLKGSNGKLRPDAEITRAESAAFMYRLLPTLEKLK